MAFRLRNRYIKALRAIDLEELRRCLEKDPSLVDHLDTGCFNYRILNYAAVRNRKDLVDLALEFGADLDLPSEFWAGDWTPLQHALNYHHLDLAEYLVKRGARVDAHGAAGLPRPELLKQQLDEDAGLVHARGGDGKQPLHFAADPEVAALLLQYGAPIDEPDVDHFSTPAQWAADHRPRVSRYLVSQGARPDIFMAVCSGDTDWVKSMIAEDPKVIEERVTDERFPPPSGKDLHCIYFFSEPMGQNATPLHVAASKNLPEMVELLVEAGMDVNVRGAYDDGTPLHAAAWLDHAEVLRRLLELGGDTEILSRDHRNTPLGWAIVAGSVNAARLLLDGKCIRRRRYAEDARRGWKGAFRDYAESPPENYREIERLLEEKQDWAGSS